MKKYFQTHPLAKTGFLGIPLLFFVILMGTYFPKHAPEGFQSFIIAFEFTKTSQNLFDLFKNLSDSEIHKINIGNFLDYGFMFTYTALLIISFWKFSILLKKKILQFGILLPILVFIFDFSENIFLLRLSENVVNADEQSMIINNLFYLNLFTWSKWITLALIFFILYSVYSKQNMIYKILGIIFLFPLIFAIVASKRTPESLSIFTSSIFLAFALLIVYLFIFRKEKQIE